MPKTRHDAWSDDAIARLRVLWDEGHSTAEIGRRMNLSKSAVVGKAHRLRLTPRPSPIVASPILPPGDNRDRAVAVMHSRGKTRPQIAAALRIGERTVTETIGRLGLPARDALLPRSGGVGSLSARGAAALAGAQAATARLRAEAPHPASSAPAAAAHPIPAQAGDPGPAGSPGVVGEPGGDVSGVSSRDLPPAATQSRSGGSSVQRGERACRWPMWGDAERPTGVFCGAAVRVRPDDTPCVYCAEHAARAFSRSRDPDAGEHRITRSTFAWGGQAA
ncbi:hypothetical protein KPL78_19250 [Roseomonas sp. HJA6]|uniref:GcrA cell cycle regulator n=1 Tax=Roseomonas alba TaxID=2846776 RepID=A0ABS7ACI1_9PROT|nr:GcrA family cell cycle regulator [Neoroseomonas alba]MBW6400006.1 hypothetical protein [Neoroseomonas alba]